MLLPLLLIACVSSDPVVDTEVTEQPVDTHTTVAVTDWGASCAADDRCTLDVPGAASVAILDAGRLLVTHGDRDSESIVMASDGVRRIDFGARVYDASVSGERVWVLLEDVVEQLDAQGRVWKRLELPEGGGQFVWGDADQVWVTSYDSGWRWRGEWQTMDHESAAGKLVHAADGFVSESTGTRAYLWDLATDSRTELYGSDDNMDWARPCGDDRFWITSSTGATLRCDTSGACVGEHGIYVQGRDAVCRDGALGVLNGVGIGWLDPTGETVSEPVLAISAVTGSPERTWVIAPRD